ncbi:GroES-like protein [Dacryopinax primogenitus]|uniref:GroES-like protein n=1 Tax=Dacryopinax primogenitus (strain DJM 731) TaxID=1858805 RepID=M5FYK9_DACPD|nr:GroES-like protein [Dacryopinax primogenitus]EJT98631.1 GroES-like protein [Dacryopinax primogenitus]
MSLPFIALSITSHKQTTPLTLLPFPEPELGPGELLIQNVAIAQNPVDWKQIDYDIGILSLPWTNGGDVAGTVYKLGPGVENFKLGDRVISFLERKTARHGAYQTYSIAASSRTVRLPETYSFEQGSTIPLAYVTAGAGLEHALGVKLPVPPHLPVESKEEPLLVWGAASSVGAYVIQLAKAAGYTVLSTASPKNHAYIKSLGASEVFDYHDPDVVSKIHTAAGANLSKVYDCISEHGSIEASVGSITTTGTGVVAVILTPKPEQSTSTVKVLHTGAKQAELYPEVGKRVYALLEYLLERGTFVPNPVRVVPGGLLGANEGLKLGREHRVSGEKLVYRVAETQF